ncbi:MAG: YhgE/Pip domain-containing protein, partial [Rhodoferax sp.]|uniref:YhgE/Pip domain-containing protein n=1 Tax=Rhodoferax sp. TaxID=50421 RepID=UPI00260C5EE6
GKTGALPVAIVNLDQGIEYQKHVFNVGQEVVAKLRARHTFGYVDFTDEQQARRAVRQGDLAFALIIPADFSSNAIPGAQVGGGKLVIYTSEGNSYQSAGLARRFAEDLGRQVNGSLNEQRWALVLSDAAGSQSNIERLNDGVNQLRLGAKELASGANQAAKGAEALSSGSGRLDPAVTQLTSGLKELGVGLRTMDARRPRNSELSRLRDGAEALAAGHVELGRGLEELQSGNARMQGAVAGFREEVGNSLLVSGRLTEGLDQLGSGLAGLDGGLKSAGLAQEKLTEGAKQLSSGVGTLATGMRALSGGIRSAVGKLPEDAHLDELAKGADTLAAGSATLSKGTQKVSAAAQHLAGGLDLLAGSLPQSVRKMDGSAQGLANSVQPVMEVDAAVQNNGSGFAPNIIPGALWLGASLAVFLIQVRLLPRRAVFFSRPAQVLGKILIPLLVVLLQALLVWLAVLFVLQVQVAHVGALALTLALAAATFLLIVFALTRALGDAGKALALIFLAVQISSSGGVLPIELSGGLFAKISPWLPITWVVKAIKACMFGAYDGQWHTSLWLVVLAAALAALMACVVGRWRFVKASAMRPALDF